MGRRRFVLSASPGSGKTTLAPLLIRHLLDEQGSSGRILIAQPRRVAVRSAAKYVASLLEEEPGGAVGWTMRSDRKISAHTRIEFTTTGSLLRRLLADPDLTGVDALLLDEVHERHIDSDLALAFALDIADMRDDLLLGAMSATADVDRFHALLASSAQTDRIEVAGDPYPLSQVWRPASAPALDAGGASPDFLSHLASTAVEAFENNGPTLVFAPSIRNVEDVAAMIRGAGIRTFTLHSGITTQQQDEALAPGERVIVATDIAETSLTVAGINCVVDSGLTRSPRFDVRREAAALVTVRASRSSATQRGGRANRTGPGVVYRCYSQTDFARMTQYATAQIESGDLTEAALLAHAWSEPEQMRLPSPFPAPGLTRAETTLEGIGALAGGQITDEGRMLAMVPADPRMGRALLLASRWSGQEQTVARIVAALATETRSESADITKVLNQVPQADVRRFRSIASKFSPSYGSASPDLLLNEADLPGVVIGLAYPGRIAKQRGKQDGQKRRFLAASGTGFSVDATSPLSFETWIAVGGVLTTGGVTNVTVGAPLQPEWARWIAKPMLRSEVVTELTGGRITASCIERLGQIELGRRRVQPTIEEARKVLEAALEERGLDLFKLGAAGLDLVNKARYISARDASWPELSNQQLAKSVDELLGEWWEDLLDGKPLAQIDVTNGLKTLIGWDKIAKLDELVPNSIELPSGNRARIVFDPERGPTVRVKLQETFGFKKVPTVMGESLTFELLSPAGRPLAITSNLETFFNETYSQVRAEMRGRYPKHPWPEDPWTATATRKTNARLR